MTGKLNVKGKSTAEIYRRLGDRLKLHRQGAMVPMTDPATQQLIEEYTVRIDRKVRKCHRYAHRSGQRSTW